jgi:hypothetical protein
MPLRFACFILIAAGLPAQAAVVNVTCKNITADTAALNTAISGSNTGDQIAIHGSCLINGIIVLYGNRTYLGGSRTGTVIRQASGQTCRPCWRPIPGCRGINIQCLQGRPFISHN